MALTTSNLAVLKSSLKNLAVMADDLSKAIRQAHDALGDVEGSEIPLKDEFGKFTSRGIEEVFRLFDKGKDNWEIAEYMDVSPSAITYQRKKWEGKRAREIASNAR